MSGLTPEQIAAAFIASCRDEIETIGEGELRLRTRRQAIKEAQAIVAHAREEAERIAAQAARDLEQSLERRQRLAEERIAQAESKAVDEIRAVAVDVAINAAREVIVADLDERRGAALLDTAIASLPQRLR